MNQWEEVKKGVLNLKKSELPDEVYSKLENSKVYTTKSMYRWVEKDLVGSSFKWIWAANIPLKI